MELNFEEALDVLRRTPAVLDTLLRGTSASWHTGTEGPVGGVSFDFAAVGGTAGTSGTPGTKKVS